MRNLHATHRGALPSACPKPIPASFAGVPAMWSLVRGSCIAEGECMVALRVHGFVGGNKTPTALVGCLQTAVSASNAKVGFGKTKETAV